MQIATENKSEITVFNLKLRITDPQISKVIHHNYTLVVTRLVNEIFVNHWNTKLIIKEHFKSEYSVSAG